ncbi:ABC-2 family transporter protein [Nitrosomonas sp. Nm51]|nr:ABC-2 family transporter protein [Nitrosomonas sp. Nm51]
MAAYFGLTPRQHSGGDKRGPAGSVNGVTSIYTCCRYTAHAVGKNGDARLAQQQSGVAMVYRARYYRTSDAGSVFSRHSLSIAREREQGTFDQLLVTSLRPVEILIGKLSPGLIIGLVEPTFTILAAVWWFEVILWGSRGALYFGLFILACKYRYRTHDFFAVGHATTGSAWCVFVPGACGYFVRFRYIYRQHAGINQSIALFSGNRTRRVS